MTKHPLNWTVGFTRQPDIAPGKFVPASVPGAVQLDWARAHGWPDHTVGDNWREYRWMEDVYWLYRAELPDLAVGENEIVWFSSKGIDYKFDIRVDGEWIYGQEGMFRPVDIELSTWRGSELCQVYRPGALLEVLVHPAPKSVETPEDRTQANHSFKPAVGYEWDWHPRLIPLGIWEETSLDVRPKLHMKYADVTYRLSEDLKTADLKLHTWFGTSAPSGTSCTWKLTEPDGSVVFDMTRSTAFEAMNWHHSIASPRLWWPHAEGDQPLYKSTFTMMDSDGDVLDQVTQRIGFRRVRLVMHPTAWDEPADFPKTRSVPPITLEINGRRIFAKGANWAPPSIFPGEITRERYAELLDLAKAGNLSILRCWGGAIVNKDAFFDLCDELGIMVWQEFMLACNDYPDDDAYLDVVRSESEAIIRRLRGHACLTIWCGGNELFNVWSGMTDQSLALRLLNSQCLNLDPHTPFLPTSPVMGMGHGPYLFRSWAGVELFESMSKAANTAYTEFAASGPASAELLRRTVPEAEFWPPARGTAWETHHGFGAWDAATSTWLMLDVLEDYFGPLENVDQLVERGQLLQSEGLRCIYECARRQKPTCSMALNWCFNEPWPCVANNSTVEWPAKPKAAYYAVAAACRPTLASAQIERFRWREGDMFSPELWMLHDATVPLPTGRVEVFLRIGAVEHFVLAWDHGGAGVSENLPGPIIRYRIPGGDAGASRMTLILRADGHPEWDSEYTLLWQPLAAADAADAATRALNQ